MSARIDSLHIQNFRAFRDLHIERLGRVNLIVGRNGRGKTSLLEALQIFVTRNGSEMLKDRDERSQYENLVYQNQNLGLLNIAVHLTNGKKRELGGEKIQQQSSPNALHPGCVFIKPRGIDWEDMQNYWDAIALSAREDVVLSALQVIEPRITRIGLNNAGDKRIPMVRLKGQDEPVTLRRLGDGIVRMFGLALVLVNAQGGWLLIDEIENGLHYSIQPDMWRLVFRIATELDVQVFATTHSSDCVRSFQQVSHEHPAEGILIRLGRQNDDIVASVFAEDDLQIAIEQDVEVR